VQRVRRERPWIDSEACTCGQHHEAVLAARATERCRERSAGPCLSQLLEPSIQRHPLRKPYSQMQQTQTRRLSMVSGGTRRYMTFMHAIN